MGLKDLHIKAKDYISLKPDYYLSLSVIKQAKLLSHHYIYKRRKLNKDVLDTFFKTLTPKLLIRLIKRLPGEEAKRKMFRSIKNIDADILNTVLCKYTTPDISTIINTIKLEDRQKLNSDVFDKLSQDKLALLINEHFSSFGKLKPSFFTDYIVKLPPETLQYLIKHIHPKISGGIF